MLTMQYAPKDRQTPALCNLPPKSVCNSDYGLSIGRGASKFPRGRWTTIRQDIWLNTPGINDGGFNIWINDRLVLTYDQVRYRENAASCGTVDRSMLPTQDTSQDASPLNVDSAWAATSTVQSDVTSTWSASAVDGEVELPHVQRDMSPQARQRESPWPAGYWQATPTIDPTISATSPPATTPSVIGAANSPSTSASDCSIGFIGLFFSTFFGGHTPDWSPNQDQYTYFKDFFMKVNTYNA